jgi:hypothetical protein
MVFYCRNHNRAFPSIANINLKILFQSVYLVVASSTCLLVVIILNLCIIWLAVRKESVLMLAIKVQRFSYWHVLVLKSSYNSLILLWQSVFILIIYMIGIIMISTLISNFISHFVAKDFSTAQKKVAELIHGRILVGHALSNDLKVHFRCYSFLSFLDLHVYFSYQSVICEPITVLLQALLLSHPKKDIRDTSEYPPFLRYCQLAPFLVFFFVLFYAKCSL